ncbi:hypothetical protein OAU50_04525 [Planctomycetota bacterium]|nr:hypothetical protein [Planctomycetota bacterium]
MKICLRFCFLVMALILLSCFPVSCTSKAKNAADNGCGASSEEYNEKELDDGRIQRTYHTGEVWKYEWIVDGDRRLVHEEAETFRDDVLFESFSCDKDVPQGPYTRYHSNGKVAEKAYFKDGFMQGTAETFHENGNVSGRGDYLDGNHNGVWAYWDEDGKELGTVTYKLGEVVETNLVE